MIDKVKELLSKDIEEIITSSLSLDLLKVYSIIYLGGKQPNSCAKSQRKYYDQLKKDGMKKAKKDFTKTCKPNWKGNRYISKEARHYNDELITDEEAITLLKRNHISEEDFVILPEGYSKTEPLNRDKLKAEAKKLKIDFKANIKTDKLADLISKVKIDKLQEERAFEIIEYGVEEAPEGLGLMTDEDYKTYVEGLKAEQ